MVFPDLVTHCSLFTLKNAVLIRLNDSLSFLHDGGRL